MRSTAITWSAGNKLEQSVDWKGAIAEFEKAAGVRDTQEARDSIQERPEEMVDAQAKAAADKALAGAGTSRRSTT